MNNVFHCLCPQRNAWNTEMPPAIHEVLLSMKLLLCKTHLWSSLITVAIYNVNYVFKFGSRENVVGIRQWWIIHLHLIFFMYLILKQLTILANKEWD